METIKMPYDLETLHMRGPQRVFRREQLSEIAFPLGGIGTGTISLGGRGNLRDFEIFGHPDKGNNLPFTFFALWTRTENRGSSAKILEGQVPPPYRNGFGEPQSQLQGVSRFRDAEFRGEYPGAYLQLKDPEVPVLASLRAWNPFIPLDVMNSALPAAIFEWTFTNTSDETVELALASSSSNPFKAKDSSGHYRGHGATNQYRSTGSLTGVLLTNPKCDPNDPAYGTISMATPWTSTTVQTRWYRGGWWDKCHLFWDDFSDDGDVAPVLDCQPGDGDVSSIVLKAVVQPGESVTLPVLFTWHMPKFAISWGEPKVFDTYVGRKFHDAWAVAEYTAANIDELCQKTASWQKIMTESSLPSYVIEAVTSQASILRSPTCFLLGDGEFYGWEGCSDKGGCCHGSCTHVWNYEQTVAFLFPQLERHMRRVEFLYNTRESGNMAFRTNLPPGESLWDFKPCADGQMGTIMQVYRDWQLSGDDGFLRELWPKVKLALEYAWTMSPEIMDKEGKADVLGTNAREKRSIDSLWDPDKDGVMEGEQHNTYDIEFFGPNTMCTAMYLGALKACEEIAGYLGESGKAAEYRGVRNSGKAIVDDKLWNGQYYIQHVKVIDGVTVPEILRSPESDAQDCGPTCACKQSPGGKAAALESKGTVPKYQYGEGCLSDQLLGQWAAHVAGLGYLLDSANVQKAVKSIFDYNFRAPIGGFSNVQRVYALNDEAGLLLCSWPKGNRPKLPFVYSDEVWTGIEYHVAAHLIYEGWIDEGLTIVKAVSERYSGHNRNPWNQVECGHHYARAMASWSVKLALDGFTYSMPKEYLGFAPKVFKEDYKTFWSTGTGWGEYGQSLSNGRFELRTLQGTLKLRSLFLADMPEGEIAAEGPNGSVKVERNGQTAVFAETVNLTSGQSIVIKVK